MRKLLTIVGKLQTETELLEVRQRDQPIPSVRTAKSRPLSQAVRQWIANPPSPVRIREGPLSSPSTQVLLKSSLSIPIRRPCRDLGRTEFSKSQHFRCNSMQGV